MAVNYIQVARNLMSKRQMKIFLSTMRGNMKRAEAVGYLVELWFLTADEAPQQGILPMSGENIEVCIGFDGEKGTLIKALVNSDFLKKITETGYEIINWRKHQPWLIEAEKRSIMGTLQSLWGHHKGEWEYITSRLKAKYSNQLDVIEECIAEEKNRQQKNTTPPQGEPAPPHKGSQHPPHKGSQHPPHEGGQRGVGGDTPTNASSSSSSKSITTKTPEKKSSVNQTGKKKTNLSGDGVKVWKVFYAEREKFNSNPPPQKISAADTAAINYLLASKPAGLGYTAKELQAMVCHLWQSGDAHLRRNIETISKLTKDNWLNGLLSAMAEKKTRKKKPYSSTKITGIVGG